MTVRVGVIGTGMIGQDHIRRLGGVVSGAEVVAVHDADGERARSVAASLPGARAAPTGHDVISDGGVDAVLVASPGPTHEEYVLASIAAGKPVFCEKPLAPTTEACLRIVQAEAASAVGRRLVQVGFMRRYDRGYLAMKAALEEGRTGPPLMVHCVHRNAANPPVGWTSDSPITDSAVHEVDSVRWLLDDEIAAVNVFTPRRSGRAPAGVQDPYVVVLETRGGVHVDVEVYVNCGYGYDVRCEVVGEHGTVSLAADGDTYAHDSVGRVAGPVPADWIERFAAAYDAEIQDWVDSVAAGAGARGPSSWDGYAATATAAAALEARRSGGSVPVTLKARPEVFHR